MAFPRSDDRPLTLHLTDIEGSTRLWEESPESMAVAVERHDQIVHQEVSRQRGRLIKSQGEGDSTFSVFEDPRAAVEAALAVQRAISSTEWPSIPLRVRVALHTGGVQRRGDDFYGPTVNRCARLRDVGHGGQVLLSGGTAELVEDALRAPSCLRDLGVHRLKDLSGEEHIFQLSHPDLPTEFPPLNSLDRRRDNLPQHLSSFVGRRDAIEHVKEALAASRLVTIAGPGGIGKTRVAIEAAREIVVHYPDGVWVINLASVTHPSFVGQAIARALGVEEHPGRELLTTLIDHLHPRSLLLVVDNCEHLVDACAETVLELLTACPHIKVLATSREALKVSGEHVYVLPTLTLPTEALSLTLGEVCESEAGRLFVERTSLARPDLQLSDQHSEAIHNICVGLDGIPLAIELAAARVNVMSPGELAARLKDQLGLLTVSPRQAPDRHRTLRAAIDWSHDLLDEGDRTLFRRMAVFAGGSSVDALQGICAEDELSPERVLDTLQSLVDKSLVIVEEREGATRYRLLGSIHEYAQERLVESGEVELLEIRHGSWYLAFAEAAAEHLEGPEPSGWLGRLEDEHDNLRAALDRCLTRPDPRLALRLVAALYTFWRMHGHLREAGNRFDAILRTAEGPSFARGRALVAAGRIAHLRAEYPKAQSYFEEGLDLFRQLGDSRGIAESLVGLARVFTNGGEDERAESLLLEAHGLYREIDDPSGIAHGLNELGEAARCRKDHEAAITRYREALQIRRDHGDRWEMGILLANMAQAMVMDGDSEAAIACAREGVLIAREVGDLDLIGLHLEAFAGAAVARGDATAAAQLLGAAEALREQTSVILERPDAMFVGSVRSRILELREPDSAEVLREQGRSMTAEDALDLALELRSSDPVDRP